MGVGVDIEGVEAVEADAEAGRVDLLGGAVTEVVETAIGGLRQQTTIESAAVKVNVQITGDDGRKSSVISFKTSADCDKNLALVHFQRNW